MKIGLYEVGGSRKFPNLPLMKLSAWHKSQGDEVEWYLWGHYDKVYVSKVFSTPELIPVFDAEEVVLGGSGFAIKTGQDGLEYYDKKVDKDLPYDVEHIYPDYSLYGITDTAYGFLSRGCPRGCGFCHVAAKEGRRARKVADLSEFWRGQKNIVLCDPNILACNDWKELLQQLIDSNAVIDINQGLDIRLMTEEKAEMLARLRMPEVHFAWDRYEDKELVVSNLELYREAVGKRANNSRVVYMVVNYNTTIEQDLDRVYTIRDLGYLPFVMIYNKDRCDRIYKRLQRWVNNRFVFGIVKKFEDYNV